MILGHDTLRSGQEGKGQDLPYAGNLLAPFASLILLMKHKSRNFYSHFVDEETEAHKD